MNQQDRLTDLEIQLTHQEDTIDQLNRVVAEQEQRLSRLELSLQQLTTEHRELKEGLSPDVTDQPPPHY